MAVSIVPALMNALFTQATSALSDRLVSYGLALTDDANQNVLMIGVDDPDGNGPAATSDAAQSMATLGTPRSRDESGVITCSALSWNGNSDQKAALEAAFTTFEAVATLLRTDPTMGVGQPGRVVCQVGDYHLSVNQYDQGCDARLTFSVNFTARI